MDGGSSDNFFHPALAKRLSLPVYVAPPFKVEVGNGELLQCEGEVRTVPVKVHDQTLFITAFLLSIASEELVLGDIWLETLDTHLVNYRKKSITFLDNNRLITLQGELNNQPTQAQFNYLKRLCATKEIAEIYTIQLQGPEAASPQSLDIPSSTPLELAILLRQYSSVFQVPQGLPPTRMQDHAIHLRPGTTPVKVSRKTEIERIVGDMLLQKDGSWRFCTDYRALNAVTIKDSFPMPTVDELLDELFDAQNLSKLYLRSGYHQIRVRPKDCFKTAFRTHQGLYEWLVMLFGLTNAPATFQSLMNSVFAPVLTILKENALFAKFSKCSFANAAFVNLKRALSLAPVLALPNFSKPFVLETDASGSGISAILSQDGHPIAYFSKKLSMTAQKQPVYAREILAIISAVVKFRHYLLGHRFVIRTNHKSLKELQNQTIQTPEQHFWLAKLLGYDFTIEYKKGSENQGANSLSRSFMGLSVLNCSLVPQLQAESKTYDPRSEFSELELTSGRWQQCQGLWYRGDKIVVPHTSSLVKTLLYEFHDSMVGGHDGY
nr:uncharacterized protein LOC112763082 [Arachis hypogaea]